MEKIVIAAYARSPFTPALKGELAAVRSDVLVAQLLRGLLEKTGVAGEAIEDLMLGCAFPEAEQGLNLARLAWLLAGLPLSVAGVTINRFCGSSMQAIHSAAGAIALGAGEAFLCAGVESMSRVPMLGYNPMPNPELQAQNPGAYMSMGQTAENVAEKYGISRTQQEAFAMRSHQKAASAQEKGRLAGEIIAIASEGLHINRDGCIRPGTTPEKLAELKPAFNEKGSVTAGTSSPLTDGAAIVLVCSESFARNHNLNPLASIRATAVAGCAPELMGMGPVAASRKALARAGLTIADMDVVELNEAFASQSLACIAALGIDEARVNLDGGAIALGHPLGATGARITGKAAQLLQREGKRFALATQCIGGGQGIATVLEKI